MTTLLDLNDVVLCRWRGADSHPSPGYARFTGDGYDFGAGARAVARRFPRELSTRYWAALDLQPLTPPLGPARHSGDLVHGHLQQLLAADDTEQLIVVPAHYSRDQLSLLLGILETLPGRILSLVDRSAAIAAMSTSAPCLHVEQQLQQTVLTPIEVADGVITAMDPVLLPGMGWLWMLDQLGSAVASQFIEQTRFDPQRRADSEQALYDALPDALEALHARGEIRLEVEGYSARVRAEDVRSVGERLRAEIERSAADAGLPWLLSPLLASLPGLVTPAINTIVTAADWPVTLQQHAATLRQTPETLRVLRSLPVTAASASAAPDAEPATEPATTPGPTPSPARETRPQPTHLLVAGHATPLADDTPLGHRARCGRTADGVVISHGDAQLQRNGQPTAEGDTLEVGDHLSDGQGWQAQLIVVHG